MTRKTPLLVPLLSLALLGLAAIALPASSDVATAKPSTKSIVAHIPYFSGKKHLPCAAIVTAHRGTMGKAENTMPGIRKALKQGADAVEVDIRQTKDGYFVAMHDATVTRTTNGTGTVAKMTLSEVKNLRAKNGATVPTLNHILRVVSSEFKNRRIHLDLKGLALNEANITRIMAQLDKHGMRQRAIITTKSLAGLQKLQELAPDIPAELIVTIGTWPEVSQLPQYINSLNADKKSVTKKRINTAAKYAIVIAERGLNTTKQAKNAINNGVMIVMSDKPAQAVKACK